MRRTLWLTYQAPGTVRDPMRKNNSIRLLREADTMR